MLIITIVFIKLIQSISCQYILLNETNLPQKYFYEFDNFLPQGFELKKEEAILLSLKSLDKSANSSLMELCTDKSKTNCVIDHNAIDFKLNIQNLRIIQQANISKVYQEKYNGIPFSHNIHLEIQSQNSFNLMAQIIQYQNCPFDCQNGGNCIQGICVCHKDYLSHDCSIKAYSILNTQTLLNTQFYFLDIHEWIEQQNNKILQFQASLEEESTIITECYAQNPYLLQNNSEIKIQQIDITVKDMNNCLNQINNLGQNQQQQFAYIIIKLKYPQKVQFLTSEIDIDQSVIGIVVGSISLFILIVVVYCVLSIKSITSIILQLYQVNYSLLC